MRSQTKISKKLATQSEGLEVVFTDSRKVVCDGTGPLLGHPRIYLKVPSPANTTECPYCSKRFELNG